MKRSQSSLMSCPRCGSARVIPIVYGDPTYETFKRAGRGEIALGGCLIDSPTHQCKNCGLSFGGLEENSQTNSRSPTSTSGQ